MFYKFLAFPDKVYLFIGSYYEYSKEFGSVSKHEKKSTIESVTRDYLEQNKVNYSNKKIYLVLDNTVIASLTLDDYLHNDRYAGRSVYQEYLSEVEMANTKIGHLEKKVTPKKKNSKITVPLYVDENKTRILDLENYVASVVASIVPISFHDEVFKAFAVLIRTKILKELKDKRVFSKTRDDIPFNEWEDFKKLWRDSYDIYFSKVVNTVTNTKGEYISYDDEYVDIYYHYSNNGRTENSVDILGDSRDYLKSVDSPWDKNSSEYDKTIIKDIEVVNHLLGVKLDGDSEINIIEKTLGNSVKSIKIDGKVFNANEIRDILKLDSSDFDIRIDGNKVIFTTRGSQFQLGLSLYGSNEMAKEGYNYKQIINHYYNNVDIKVI